MSVYPGCNSIASIVSQRNFFRVPEGNACIRSQLEGSWKMERLELLTWWEKREPKPFGYINIFLGGKSWKNPLRFKNNIWELFFFWGLGYTGIPKTSVFICCTLEKCGRIWKCWIFTGVSWNKSRSVVTTQLEKIYPSTPNSTPTSPENSSNPVLSKLSWRKKTQIFRRWHISRLDLLEPVYPMT